MLDYIKTAFLNRWNLLLLAGGMGFSIISGQPEIGIPLVLAAETAYLGLLGTHPKFQRYVNAQEAKTKRKTVQQKNEEVLERITRSLPPASLSRYENLKKRCQLLGNIASDLKEPTVFGDDDSLDTMHSRGLDRMLWVFLRLLFSQHKLEQFQHTVSEEKMQADLRRISDQLNTLGEKDQSANATKIRRTLEDNRKTIEERLKNYDEAKNNHLFVVLELERLENKIKSLSELSVNRQDPDYISDQIDLVTDSMKETERTMNDLQFMTGIGTLEDDAPELLSDQQTEMR